MLIIALTVVMSQFFDVAYIHTVIIVICWTFFGHLMTLNDDKPGGWCNPKRSQNHWRFSILSLLIKLVILLFSSYLLWKFPAISTYGS